MKELKLLILKIMKKLNNKLNRISIRIILVFTVISIMSFVPEHYRDFFGDWYCSGTVHDSGYRSIGECDYIADKHCSTLHYGYRHWLWIATGLSLFIVQVIKFLDILSE